MSEEIKCTQVVKKIIEDKLQTDDFVYKQYVVEIIKLRIDPVRLVNKIFNYPDDRTDGPTDNASENIHRGAEKVYRDSIRGLVDQGIFRVVDNKISYRKRKNEKLYEHDGRLMTLGYWAKLAGIRRDTLYRRLERNWPLGLALVKPPLPHNHMGDKTLMNVATENWMTLDELRVRFCEVFSDDKAILRYNNRHDVECRYWAKKGKPRKPRKKLGIKEKIESGKKEEFRSQLYSLIKNGRLEKNENKVRKVCKS